MCQWHVRIVFFFSQVVMKISGTIRYIVESIQVIPQGTVDNNLGPDRLVGLVDPNY